VPIISGGNVIPPSATARQKVFSVEGIPTDANIGLPTASIVNGLLAQNVTTGFVYERRAGAWVRCDTL
jgi:hypothetical protein